MEYGFVCGLCIGLICASSLRKTVVLRWTEGMYRIQVCISRDEYVSFPIPFPYIRVPSEHLFYSPIEGPHSRVYIFSYDSQK